MRSLALSCLCLLSSLAVINGCTGSASRPNATPQDDVDIYGLLNRASENLRDADTLRVAVDMNFAKSTQSKVHLAAEVRYVAPNSLSGFITLPDGSGDFIVVDDRVFVRGEAEWLEFDDVPRYIDFEYSGGLLDLTQLIRELTLPTIETSSKTEVVISAGMGSAGLNSYLIRRLEYIGVGGLTPFLVRNVEIAVDPRTEEFRKVVFSGTNSADFMVELRFNDFNSKDSAPTVPVNATPISRYKKDSRFESTPIVPVGCAKDIDVTKVDVPIGQTYRANEIVQAAIEYSAPGCKNVIAEFVGKYGPDSPRYRRVCYKQCDESIAGVMTSDPFTLPVDASANVIVWASETSALLDGETHSQRVDGFRLCMVNLTFSDGALGGTFFRYSIGKDC